jgi:hypothetical protein
MPWTCAKCGENHSLCDEGYHCDEISFCIGCGDSLTPVELEQYRLDYKKRKGVEDGCDRVC